MVPHLSKLLPGENNTLSQWLAALKHLLLSWKSFTKKFPLTKISKRPFREKAARHLCLAVFFLDFWNCDQMPRLRARLWRLSFCEWQCNRRIPLSKICIWPWPFTFLPGQCFQLPIAVFIWVSQIWVSSNPLFKNKVSLLLVSSSSWWYSSVFPTLKSWCHPRHTSFLHYTGTDGASTMSQVLCTVLGLGTSSPGALYSDYYFFLHPDSEFYCRLIYMKAHRKQ